jgi:hypothetical protein
MRFAEDYAVPVEGKLGVNFPRNNDFKEVFYLRWGRVRFDAFWGIDLNLKVIFKVYRSDGVCEHFVVDTDPRYPQWNFHQRVTRDFFVHPFPQTPGPRHLRQVRLRRAHRRAVDPVAARVYLHGRPALRR